LNRRLRAPANPVTITLDGQSIIAEAGEPLAATFVAAGQLGIARSPKFHRPRGPSCLRAACDGCLARVDDVPNVMTCMTAAREGMSVVSQNRLGTRDADLLRMTDWFFPEGLNHHEIFAGVPGVQAVMQAFARRVAGLGRLPGADTPPRRAERRSADVVVVGGGAAGMMVALRLAKAGREVELLDDQLQLGGSILALGKEDRAPFAATTTAFEEAVKRRAIRARVSTTACGVYGTDLLVVGPEGAQVIEPRALVLACGAHDGILTFENNDVPGVMSARAAGFLLNRGVLVGKKIAVVLAEGGGPFGASFARAAAVHGDVTVVNGAPRAVKGGNRAKSVTVGRRTIACDAVVVDAPRSPAYELAAQAGATLAHEPRGYVVKTTPKAIYATGEMTGTPLVAPALASDAARVAERVLASGPNRS
jgi:sarcosine oxidase subunit alpha